MAVETEISHRRLGKYMRRLMLFSVSTVCLLLLFSAAIIGGGTIWLRSAMRRSLPQLDGRVSVSGLSQPVTVRRDKNGVPYIEAAALDDLFEAQGYIHAQDRLWEMDMARRAAGGNLAEILGPTLVEHDRVQRVLAVRTTAQRMASRLAPQDREYLQAYAKGVNAYIQSHAKQLPAEMSLLFYKPAPWQVTDSILIGLNMVQLLDEHWPEKMGREAITNRIGVTLANALYPTGSWRDRQPFVDGPADHEKAGALTSEPSGPQSAATAEDLLQLQQVLHGGKEDFNRPLPGSNGWVLSGQHTATGQPILANDMHLPHQIPNIWYEIDLRSADFHAAGLSIPGMPFVVTGHNEDVAWGLTALCGDTQDVYIEQVKNGLVNDHGEWRPLTHVRDVIRVRGGSDVVLDLMQGPHGPIISSLLPHENRVLALKWSAYDPQSGDMPLFSLNTAKDWDSFRAGLKHWWGPTLNVMYADRSGHIGYQAVGFIPRRPDGIVGIPIGDDHHEWHSFVNFEDLPTKLDPAGGIIATANSRVTSNEYPFQLSLEWGSPYREDRILDYLATNKTFTQADMLALQNDIYSDIDRTFAKRFALAIDRSSNITDPRLRQASQLLRNWDGVLSIDSSAAAIVSSAKGAFWPMILEPKLGKDGDLYDWAESAFVQEQILMDGAPDWLPKPYRTWDDFLSAMVEQGLQENGAPSNLQNWRYGDFHQVEIEHPIYGLIPWMRSWTGTKVNPQSGDESTVKQVARTFGPSQRFSIDWSNIDGATENILTGQSGDPVSPWYLNQWPYWYAGSTLKLPFTAAAVQTSTAHTLILLP
jgi:penicillin G amidase